MQQLKEHRKSLQQQLMTNLSSETRKSFCYACRAVSDLTKNEKKKHLSYISHTFQQDPCNQWRSNCMRKKHYKNVITLPYANEFWLTIFKINQANPHKNFPHGQQRYCIKCRWWTKNLRKEFLLSSGKSVERLEYIKLVITDKLSQIDNSMVSPEYKIWIYQKYILPSVRFLPTVH